MFIASKLKETCPVSAEKLVIYTDHSITLSMLMVNVLLNFYQVKSILGNSCEIS
jgi:hypothetical protein